MTHTSPKFRPRIGMHAAGQRLRCGEIPTPTAFRKDEDGAVVMFTLFALLMMLIAGGIAIDVMRQEMNRARIQNTLDTAVLAGAGAPYGTKPKAIVQDFMAKAGMAEYLGEIDDDGLDDNDDIIQTLNSSKVSARAKMSMDTILMHMSGVKQLGASAASSAERRVPKLEVAMVLDVSGSMGKNSKLSNLKVAGKKFITSILGSSEPGHAVISVVPFSWDVTPGQHIFDALKVDPLHSYSTCLQFNDDDFKTAALDPSIQQLQLIYTSEDDDGFGDLQKNARTCYTEDYAELLPYSINETALHGKMEALKASGNTSGNMGMKWGAALLDPKFTSVKTALSQVVIGQKAVLDAEDKPILGKDDVAITEPIYMVDPLVGVVPAAYDEGETLKVIVMMGDGQNTYSNQFPVTSSHRGPKSLLHKVSREGREPVYYLYDPGEGKYLNLESDTKISASKFEKLHKDLDGFLSSEQLSWEMAWGMMSPDFLNDEFGYSSAENEFEGYNNRVQGSEKDTQMDDICTAAKKKGVIIYTIGFEIGVGSTAEIELKDCATSQAHYYPTNGKGITDAFSSIASNVVNLRLTQ